MTSDQLTPHYISLNPLGSQGRHHDDYINGQYHSLEAFWVPGSALSPSASNPPIPTTNFPASSSCFHVTEEEEGILRG